MERLLCALLLPFLLVQRSSPATFEGSHSVALSISNGQGEFFLTWPLSATNWVLEQAADVQPSTRWQRISSTMYESNAISRYVRVSGGEGRGFYRLRQVGPPVPGLRGYWAVDEGTGQRAEDGSTSGTLMFFTNASWTTGRIGPGALRFNGGDSSSGGKAWVRNDNYGVLPASGQPFSVSLWFSPNAMKDWQFLAGSAANGRYVESQVVHCVFGSLSFVCFCRPRG